MTQYRYVLATLGEPFAPIAEAPLADVEYQRLRNGAGTFRATLKMPGDITTPERKLLASVYKEATEPGVTCVYILRDNAPMGVWALWDRTYDALTQTVSIGGAELVSYWRRRIIEHPSGDLDDTLQYNSATVRGIVRELLSAANDVGATIDSPSGGAVFTVGWKGTDAKQTLTAIQEYADQGYLDYRTELLVGATGDYQRVIKVRAVLGEKVAAFAKLGTNTATWMNTCRGDIRASDVIAIGGSDTAKRPWGRASEDMFKPKLTTIVQLIDETDTARLDAAADSSLMTAEMHDVLNVGVTVSNLDSDLANLQPGDLVRAKVLPGYDPWYPDGYDHTLRMIGFTVNVPNTGGIETVILHVDDDAGALQGV